MLDYRIDHEDAVPSLSRTFLVSFYPDVYISQCDHHGAREVHPVHHPWQFCPALAGDPLQHVHVCVPLPSTFGHHDLLLHTNPH